MRRFGRVFATVVLMVLMVVALTACGSRKTDIRRFDNTSLALNGLMSGEIDAVVADSQEVLKFLEENPDSGLETFTDSNFDANHHIAVKAGSDIAKFADLKGKKVGVQNAATEELLTEYINTQLLSIQL